MSHGPPDPTRPDPTHKSPLGGGDESPKPKRATQIPEDFRPAEKHEALADRARVSTCAREWPRFVDHHTAKGSTFKDWDAALRNWIRNANKFGGNVRALPKPGADDWMRRRL